MVEVIRFIMTFHNVTEAVVPDETIRIEDVYRYENGIIYPCYDYQYDYKEQKLYFDKADRYLIYYIVEVDEDEIITYEGCET